MHDIVCADITITFTSIYVFMLSFCLMLNEPMLMLTRVIHVVDVISLWVAFIAGVAVAQRPSLHRLSNHCRVSIHLHAITEIDRMPCSLQWAALLLSLLQFMYCSSLLTLTRTIYLKLLSLTSSSSSIFNFTALVLLAFVRTASYSCILHVGNSRSAAVLPMLVLISIILYFRFFLSFKFINALAD